MAKAKPAVVESNESVAVVLQPFAWSRDGYTVERLKVGDEREFGDITKSLVESGHVKEK